MTVLFSLAVLIVAFFALSHYIENLNYNAKIFGFINVRWQGVFSCFSIALAVIFSIALAVILLITVMNHATANAEIVGYNSLKQSIATARANGTSDVERAAILERIITMNKNIDHDRYWKSTVMGFTVPSILLTREHLQ